MRKAHVMLLHRCGQDENLPREIVLRDNISPWLRLPPNVVTNALTLVPSALDGTRYA
jgi:hypothetical protein